MMQKFSSTNAQIPHYVAAAWAMAANTDSSAKGLNAYKITQAAATIADREGLGMVTIRSIAKQTGFSTMAVYRHIESRDEIMQLLIEFALGKAPEFGAPTWQENVKSWAGELLKRYNAHPWALELPVAGIPTMPNHISWIEQILRILAPTGLPLQTRLDMALLIDGHVRQFAGFSKTTHIKATRIHDLQWLEKNAADVAPTLMLALHKGAMQSRKGPDFDVGISTIIKGIEASNSNQSAIIHS